MSKAERVGHLRVEGADGLDPHYAGWFACFNRGEYYEAHDVLEQLWLRERHQRNDHFYKGLIQLAGAFVHLQKGRLRPSEALFRLADANLREYGSLHERLDLERVLGLIAEWRAALSAGGYEVNPLGRREAPRVEVEVQAEGAGTKQLG
jgi:predicted metal-dependent hydrolase